MCDRKIRANAATQDRPRQLDVDIEGSDAHRANNSAVTGRFAFRVDQRRECRRGIGDKVRVSKRATFFPSRQGNFSSSCYAGKRALCGHSSGEGRAFLAAFAPQTSSQPVAPFVSSVRPASLSPALEPRLIQSPAVVTRLPVSVPNQTLSPTIISRSPTPEKKFGWRYRKLNSEEAAKLKEDIQSRQEEAAKLNEDIHAKGLPPPLLSPIAGDWGGASEEQDHASIAIKEEEGGNTSNMQPTVFNGGELYEGPDDKLKA